MDLHNIKSYIRPSRLEELHSWDQSWGWLAGGTWLFSQPQPDIKGLVDLELLGWSKITQTSAGLEIGAMCSLAQLLHYPWPKDWIAIQALQAAIESLASFKVTHQATVGGNLCLALSVGSLAPVMIVLDAVYELCTPTGSTRHVSALQFQLSDRQTVLYPGEALRRIHIPHTHLTWETCFQRIGIATTDPALAIVVRSHHLETGEIRFGLNASISAPCLLQFASVPTLQQIQVGLDTQVPKSAWIEDFRASAVYRQQMTQVLMQRSLSDLL